MASHSSPFSQVVVGVVRKLYPESLADKSFDNTGLMLEAPHLPEKKLKNSVLLTIDLTKAVAQEAIEKKVSVVVAYHPIIFRGLKSLTFNDTQQSSLLRLAAEGISVYSPHTAVDAAEGGNADWLADIVTAEYDSKSMSEVGQLETGSKNRSVQLETGTLSRFPSSFDVQRQCWKLGANQHDRTVIVPNATVPNAGMGRIVKFEKFITLEAIFDRLLSYLGAPAAISVALPQGLEQDKPGHRMVSSIGICAGSGGSLLNNLDADLLLTGELSHHEALAATEKDIIVISLGHSNSERGYLGAVMQDKLLNALQSAWAATDTDKVEVLVSEADRDPYLTLVHDPAE